MLQSMFSGISGLRTHQQRMDVIGNDIANVNTPGYKQSDVSFKEAYVKTLRAPSSGTPGMQVGLGSQIGGIVRNFSGGTLMETGQTSNLAISGNGFLVAAEPDGTSSNLFYTRAGDFILNVDSATGNTYLINPDGKRLQGDVDPTTPGYAPSWNAATQPVLTDVVLPTDTSSFSVGLDGMLYCSVSGGDPESYGRIPIATFDNNTGLEALGNNLYRATDAANIRAYANPGEGGTGQIFQGYLENSNVDLAQEFTEMIITQRGFQANSRTITTSDEMLKELLSLKR